MFLYFFSKLVCHDQQFAGQMERDMHWTCYGGIGQKNV